jgi:hypothetical protein
MDEFEAKRMQSAYSDHLAKWREGKAQFMTPAEWMADWLAKKAYRIVHDRIYSSMGCLEA